MENRILTADDLAANPELEAQGLKVGDPFEVPNVGDMADDPALAEKAIDAPPIVTGEVNHNLHEAEVLAYDEAGKPELKIGDVIRTGVMMTLEQAENANFLAQRAPVGGTMHVFVAA